jgi:O-antigen ligase
LVPFIPFVVSGTFLFPFIAAKGFIFRLIVEIVFALWLVLILRDSEHRPQSSKVLYALSAFVLIVLIADIFAVDQLKAFWSNNERMEGFMSLIHLFALFLVAGSVFRTKNIWDKFFATNVGASAVMAIYSYFQIAGQITINQGGVRVDGTFGNASYLAIYMVFNIFLAALLFVNARSKSSKYLLAGVVLMDLVVLYFTATRGAILGIMGGAFIAFVYLAMKANKGEKIRKVAAGFIIALVIGAGAFWAVKDTAFVNRSPVLSRFSNLSFAEIQSQGRYFVWPMAWKAFLEKPVLGWGQEGFNYAFNKYYDSRMHEQEQWFDRTHNIVLDWLINAGLLGLLTYVGVFVSLIYSIRKAGEKFSKEERAILYGLLFAYVFHNMFVFDQIGSYIMFFSLLAYVHSQTLREFPGMLDRIYQKIKNSFATESMKPIGDAAIAIAGVVVLYLVVYIPWRENVRIIEALRAAASETVAPIAVYTNALNNNISLAETLDHVPTAVVAAASKPEATEEFKQSAVEATTEAFKRHLARAPYDVRHKLFYATFLSQIGFADEALKELEEAAKLSPGKQTIYIEIGSQLIATGKFSEALEKFRHAYELEPSYSEAQFMYAVAAVYAKNTDLEKQLLQGISEQKLIFDDRYLGALFLAGRHDEVVEVLNKRISVEPVNTRHRITLASIYLQIGMRDLAVSQLQEIIEINPSFKEQGEYFINEIRAGRNP